MNEHRPSETKSDSNIFMKFINKHRKEEKKNHKHI